MSLFDIQGIQQSDPVIENPVFPSYGQIMHFAEISAGAGSTIWKVNKEGQFMGAETFATAPFRVNYSGAVVASDITITGGTISGAVVSGLGTGSLLNIQGWSFSGVFSATDSDTVAWTAGTITLGDGTTFSIVAGNTGNISALTYIYFDKNLSTTVLQCTYTSSNSVGGNKILVAVAQNETGKNATFQAFGGKGIGQLITAQNIASNTITANEIASNTITANQIASGTITSTQIQAGSINADRINTSQLVVGINVGLGTATTLSTATTYIVGNYITTGYISALGITAGSVSANNVTAGTITGSSIQASANGNTIVLNSNNHLYFYNSSNTGVRADLYTSGDDFFISTADDIKIVCGGTEKYRMGGSYFRPTTNEGTNLGEAGAHFNNCMAKTFYGGSSEHQGITWDKKMKASDGSDQHMYFAGGILYDVT